MSKREKVGYIMLAISIIMLYITGAIVLASIFLLLLGFLLIWKDFSGKSR